MESIFESIVLQNKLNKKTPYKPHNKLYTSGKIELRDIAYPHQKDAISWMLHMARTDRGGILGDAPGLGKTRTAILFIFEYFKPRNLIVVPPSVLYHWLRELLTIMEEYTEYYNKNINLFNIYSGESERKLRCSRVYIDSNNIITLDTQKIYIKDMIEPYIYVVNYESIIPLVKISRKEELKADYDVFNRDLTPFPDNVWDVVIADEAHHLKNGVNMGGEETKRGKTLNFGRMMRLNMSNGGVRFALTGTLIQNRYSDAVSVLRWIKVLTKITTRRLKIEGIKTETNKKVRNYNKDKIKDTIIKSNINFYNTKNEEKEFEEDQKDEDDNYLTLSFTDLTNSDFGRLLSRYLFRRKLSDLNLNVQRQINVPRYKPMIEHIKVNYKNNEAKFYTELTRGAIKDSGLVLYGGMKIDNSKLLILLNSLLLLSADINTFIDSINKKFDEEDRYPYWEEEQTKTTMIVEKLSELSSIGESCIVFTLFHIEMDGLENAVNQYLDPEGKNDLPLGFHIFKISGIHTKKLKDREQVLTDCRNLISNGKKCLLFVQIETGGEGLNMQMFHYQIFTTPHWNPAMEYQAISRCQRIGQKKQVYIYKYEHNLVNDARLIKSIDIYIRDLQSKKEIRAKDVYNVPNAAMTYPRNKIYNGEYATFPKIP